MESVTPAANVEEEVEEEVERSSESPTAAAALLCCDVLDPPGGPTEAILGL